MVSTVATPQISTRVSFNKPNLVELESQWRLLEEQSDVGFFLSWSWISTWLTVLLPQATYSRFAILRTYDGEELIGIGLLVLNKKRYHRCLPSKVIRFHQTGDELLDQVWPEYNGLLVSKGRESEVYASALPYLKEHLSWDELIIGVITQKTDRYLSQSWLDRYFASESSAYGVDLGILRQSATPYLGSLSRNTRHQIKRSIKLYKELGSVELEFAKSTREALELFEKIAPLHIARWGSASGFNNPAFVEFHRSLINQAFDQGAIEIVSLNVGDHTLGYLYNFLFKGRLYFYLSGIDYQEKAFQDKRMKPGLVMHALKIQHCLDDQPNVNIYDFMGGDLRYKKSLGDKTDDMWVVHYQQKRKRFLLQASARKIKHKILSVTSKGTLVK